MLRIFETMPDVLQAFPDDITGTFQSKRLRALLTCETQEGGLFPNLDEEITPFKEMVAWKRVGDE